jgi:hypothetical protein
MPIEEEWKKFSAKNNIPFVSLYPYFITPSKKQNYLNRKKYYIPNDSHWNAAGHQLVADTLYNYLKP